ncbi:MAG TPA: FGGY family carbohydrate kinase [Anaerolineaceae bacterium]|jgi:xylulokinase
MDDLILGLDIGTSRIKGVLTTSDGRLLAKAAVDYPTAYPGPGWAEQDPADWWRGVVQVTRTLTAQTRGVVAGIGVSGQGCAVTLIGARGQVIRPAIIWMDSRSEIQSERLRRCCTDEILEQNGKLPAPYNADPVLMWLMDNEPASIAAAETSLTTTAYINFCLTGQKVANLSDASILLAFDLAERNWSRDLIDSFGIPERFYPPLAACDQIIGVLSPAAAAELGLEAGIPVVAGGEDTSSAGLAAGAVSTGQTYLSLGTAGTIYVPVGKASVHRKLLTFLHVLSGQYLVGGSMVALGGSLNWCRKILDPQASFEDMFAMASQSAPGAGRLIFLPYLSGELQPINDGYARGALFGLSLSTEKADIIRAVLEGAAFAIAHNLSVIESLNIPVKEIRAVGGPTRSALWCQIIADVTGRPLNVLADDGGAALGDALLAAKGAGFIRDPAETARRTARIERSYTPDPRLVEQYRNLFGVYCELYPQVKEQYARLSSM